VCKCRRQLIKGFVTIKPAGGAAAQGTTPAEGTRTTPATPAQATTAEGTRTTPATTATATGTVMPISFGSKAERTLTLLHTVMTDPETYGEFKGAVIYCDCSDSQTERLADVIKGSGLPVAVYTILLKHSMSRRTSILDAISGTAGGQPPVLLVRYRMCAVGLNFRVCPTTRSSTRCRTA